MWSCCLCVTSWLLLSCSVITKLLYFICSDALHCCNYSACMRCRLCLSSGCACNDGKAGDSRNISYSSSRWCLFYEWYFTRAGTIVCMYLWPIWPGPHHHFVLQSMTQGLLLPIAKHILYVIDKMLLANCRTFLSAVCQQLSATRSWHISLPM